MLSLDLLVLVKISENKSPDEPLFYVLTKNSQVFKLDIKQANIRISKIV